jgi:phenylalanyl-tRNA synthetase beta chain
VEEILRIHGTERIPAAPVVSVGLAAEDDPVVAFNRRVTPTSWATTSTSA